MTRFLSFSCPVQSLKGLLRFGEPRDLDRLPVSRVCGGYSEGLVWIFGIEELLRCIVEFLDTPTLLALIGTCIEMKAILYQNDWVWKERYAFHRFDQVFDVPVMRNCGTWREVLLRALRDEVMLVVRPLGHNGERFKFIVSRGTTLFGLKKIMRREQLKRYSFCLEDFELINLSTFRPIGVQGYDALPPADLSVLFVSSETVMRSVRRNESFRQLLRRNHRPAWRRTLRSIEDGAELAQVFVDSEGSLQTVDLHEFSFEHQDTSDETEDTTEGSQWQRQAIRRRVSFEVAERRRAESLQNLQCCDALQEMAKGQLNLLVDRIFHEEEQEEAFDDLCALLADARFLIGVNAHKPFWTSSSLHPLLHVAFAETKVPLSMRLRAISEFFSLFTAHLQSQDFVVAVGARTFIQSGFLAVFLRLIRRLIPLIVRTQVKQVLEGEIDWVPVVFATKFMIRASIIVFRAASPIATLAFCHEVMRSLSRTIYNEESERDDLYIYAILVAFLGRKSKSRLKIPWAKWKQNSSLMRVIDRILNLDDLSPYARLTRRCSKIVWLYMSRKLPRAMRAIETAIMTLSDQPVIQYALSGVVWSIADKFLSHATSVSLPVFAYAVPFILSIMLIRLRLALSDSYYYMIYI